MALETWIMHACMVGDAGGIERSNLRAPTRPMARRPTAQRGTQRRTRHRRTSHRRNATVSSTSSFCRRCRRRRLLGRQATTDKPHQAEAPQSAPDAARGALPSPPHLLHSTRAHSAPSVGRCTGTSWPDLGVRARLHRSARVMASRRGARGVRRKGHTQVDGKRIVGSSSVLRRAWSRPQRGGGARVRADEKKV